MKSLKAIEKGQRAERNGPFLPADLVRLPEEPAGQVPQELLRAQDHLFIEGGEPQAERVGEHVWRLQPNNRLIVGHPVEHMERVSHETLVHALGDEEVPAQGPAQVRWAAMRYTPRLAPAPTRRTLVRRSGSKVKGDYVFGNDDRVNFYPTQYPWHCIGRIFVWTDASAPNWSWSGSGALVGRNVLLTASHVVPWGHDGKWKALFVPAFYDGSSTLGSSVSSWVSAAHGYADHDQGDDMAVMRLSRNLGDELGYFGTRQYTSAWEDGAYWTLVGYPGAIASGNRPTYQGGISVIDDDNDGAGVELEHQADTSPGNSGGPLFGWWTEGPYIIGTHSGGEEEYRFPFSVVKNNVAAGGAALNRLVRWARENW